MFLAYFVTVFRMFLGIFVKPCSCMCTLFRSFVYCEPEMMDVCHNELSGVCEEYLVVAAEVCCQSSSLVFSSC